MKLKVSLFVGILVLVLCAFLGCGGGGGGNPPALQEAQRTSDDTGTVSITGDGHCPIVVKDAETGEPLPGITAEVIYGDTSASVLLTDPNGNYIPRLVGINEEETRLAYSLPKEYVLHLWSKYVGGGSKLVYDDRLPPDITRRMLESHYVFWRQTTLAKLDITLMDFAEIAVDKGADALVVAGLSVAATPATGTTYGAITQYYSIASLSNTIFYQTQAMKYRAQGYQDDQKFEIWRMKVSNPRFAWPVIVLPVERPEGSAWFGDNHLGYLRAELTWDTPGTDVDLHLVKPGGTLFDDPSDCYFPNVNPDWGWAGNNSDDPRLDFDDRDGFGPENITIYDPHDDGLYQFIIHYYADDDDSIITITNAYLKVWINDKTPVEYGPFELIHADPTDGDAWLALTVSSTDSSIRSTRSRLQLPPIAQEHTKKPSFESRAK